MVCLALLTAAARAAACPDAGPPDRDADGLPDAREAAGDSDGDGCDDEVDDDDDGDGVPTLDEDFDGDGDYDDDSERVNRGDRPGAWLDASTPLDDDGDGFVDANWGGDDCADSYGTAHPGGTETWYNGVDEDCDGWPDNDQDRDGTAVRDDCDDTDPEAFPGAVEDAGPRDLDCDEDGDPHNELLPTGGCACASGPSAGLGAALPAGLVTAAALARRRRC